METMDEKKSLNTFLQLVLSLAVLICGVVVAMWLLQTSPKAKPQKRGQSAVLVEVDTLTAVSKKIHLSALGTVQPSLEVKLQARVSGEILVMNENVIPGGYVKKGEVLFQLDPLDYEIVARQLAGEVQKAEYDLEIERGNQLVARKEFELLGEKVRPEEKNLILRQPQLRILTAALETARAKYEKVQLDIARTSVKAPFNGVVQSRYVNIGSQITVSTPLIALVGTDEFWVEVTLPVRKLRWLNIPGDNNELGSSVTITSDSAWGAGVARKGRIVRLAADLEEKGRMAKLLVSVKDPLLLQGTEAGRQPLLIGSYVQVEIAGIQVENAVMIERRHLREGNSVWLMDAERKLRIRMVDIIYKDHERVYIAGVHEGEKIIISDLSVAVEGMVLRLQGDTKISETGTGKERGVKRKQAKERLDERN